MKFVRVDYTRKESGYVLPVAYSKKSQKAIAVVTNNPITTRKFRWGDLVLLGRGKIIKKVSSIPNKRDWDLNIRSKFKRIV